MKLLVLAAWLSVATAGGASTRAFWHMISCLIPNISPYHTFDKYGCFCGLGGKGAPVDALDRCCQTHDRCWGQAVELGHCSSLLGFMTLLRIYSYSCTNKHITCSSENGPCADFLCKCDHAAAICFARAPRPREEYYNLDREKHCRA